MHKEKDMEANTARKRTGRDACPARANAGAGAAGGQEIAGGRGSFFENRGTKTTQHEIAKTPAARVYSCRHALARGLEQLVSAENLRTTFCTGL